MGRFVADKTVKLMISKDIKILGSRALILGFTFKENCPDTRNTKVTDVVSELQEFGIQVDVYDPCACADAVRNEYGINLLTTQPLLSDYQAIILAVAHDELKKIDFTTIKNHPAVLFDVKGILPKALVDGRL
jgi:UDP-N-acetyl-D-galactosamine dehydrogenase